MVKTLLKQWLRKSGRQISLINEYEEKLDPVKNNWLINKNIKTIFDIGASDGGFAQKARELFPTAKIYSFEVLPDIYEKLSSRFKNDNLLYPYNIALNNFNGKTSFYRCESTGSSSLLEMDDLHKIAYPFTAKNEEITVNCSRLDDFISQNNINIEEEILIKIDVQGAEKMILEGAPNLLDKSSIIFSEVNFNNVYKGNSLFNEYSNFLYKLGFKIEGIENISQSLIDGTFLQADAYFTKIKK